LRETDQPNARVALHETRSLRRLITAAVVDEDELEFMARLESQN
jgi:hypothetical protein